MAMPSARASATSPVSSVIRLVMAVRWLARYADSSSVRVP